MIDWNNLTLILERETDEVGRRQRGGRGRRIRPGADRRGRRQTPGRRPVQGPRRPPGRVRSRPLGQRHLRGCSCARCRAAAREYARWVQTRLNDQLNLRLPVDGVISPATRSAIRDFQRREGLPVDGIVGPATERALAAGGGGVAEATSPPASADAAGGNGVEPAAEDGGEKGELPPSPRGSSAHIRWVQNALNKILGTRLVVDGKSGPATQSAIRSFQQRQGLTVDGKVGSQTEAALVAALGDNVAAGTRPGPHCEVLHGFEFDRDTLKPQHQRQIAAIAKTIAAGKVKSVRVVGHTDPVGDASYNMGLGQRRAEQAVAALRDALNRIKPGLGRSTHIMPESRGERDPIPGDAGRSRRVEICYVPGTKPSRLSVEQIRITNDSFTAPLTWDQVIGLDTKTLNLEIIASGLSPTTMPAQIRVELLSHVPNQANGTATLRKPFILDVHRVGPHPANPHRIVYRSSRPLDDIGDFLKVERHHKEVTTIVRSGGTSDVQFRRALGWNPRGMGTQPIKLGTSTGSAANEIPDAFALFRSAGVEVLEVRVPTQPNWRVPGTLKRLIRSPADVVYYSGHGLKSGILVIDTKNRPCPQRGVYQNWLGPADLVSVWRNSMDLDVLILAGCSVLKIDFPFFSSISSPSGPGLAWARLLTSKGGPLTTLLGYGDAAPCDNPIGDKIAREMARRMAHGSTNFVRDWLKVNGDNKATNAVAMDARGYWWIEKNLLGGYDIKGPTPIP